MEKLYFLEEYYDEWLSDATVIDSGSEGTIMSYGDEVIKILHSNLNAFTKYRLRRLSEMSVLENSITMPTKEIYYDYRFIGFAMKYAGINLRDFFLDLLNQSLLTDDIKIEYLIKVRDCLTSLNGNGVIHGDIQPRNILVNNGKVLLGDINNCNFGSFKSPYLNEIALRLYHKYGLCPLIDLQTFNYFCYCIMNMNSNDLRNLLNVGGDAIWYYDLRDIPNKFFIDSVSNLQLDVMYKRNSKKKALNVSDYLINHLK